MPEFELQCVVGVSGYTKVRAKNLSEAIAKAEGRPVRFAATGDADPKEAWVVEDADGVPQDIRLNT